MNYNFVNKPILLIEIIYKNSFLLIFLLLHNLDGKKVSFSFIACDE